MMQKGTAATLALLLFGAALAADLVFTATGLGSLRYISKPLILLALTAYFLFSVRDVSSPLKWWVAAALMLSWLGDVLLLFEERSPMFFILGLSAFLLAHVGYAAFFNLLRKAGKLALNPLFLVFVGVYYGALVFSLYPYLDNMKLPVFVYGLVISTMLVLALCLGPLKERIGLFIVLGALLFVLSDSVLAINKFMRPFTGAGVLIMLTYGMAQFFIVSGSILVLQKGAQRKLEVEREAEL
jgi:uncharacterized membrane protein YhhN